MKEIVDYAQKSLSSADVKFIGIYIIVSKTI